MANTYYYRLVGNRNQTVLFNNQQGWGPLSHVPYNTPGFAYPSGASVFLDFRGVLVGRVATPQQLGVSVPYPQFIQTPDKNSDSGTSWWKLFFGEMPQFSPIPVTNPAPVYARNYTQMPVAIGPNSFLSTNMLGIGLEPRFTQGRYSPIYGYGIFPVGPYPLFEEQRPENPAQAASHLGYNNAQSVMPATANALKFSGLFPPLTDGSTDQSQGV